MAAFTVGSTTIEVVAGQVIIVPAVVPHKFMNASDGQLASIYTNVRPVFVKFIHIEKEVTYQ